MLAWTRKVTFNSQGLWAAAALSLVAAVFSIANMVTTLKKVGRLHKHGVSADATIVKIKEHYVNIPSGFTGWVTTVEVSFVDAHGGMVRAKYTEHYSRVGGRHAGQMVRIFYDPEKPSSISPVGSSSRPEDPRSFDAFLVGLGTVVFLWMSVYFTLRALG